MSTPKNHQICAPGDFAALELHFDCVADEDEILEWSATRRKGCCRISVVNMAFDWYI
jgi:hypothetical protein